jgi:hypothetical protein
MDFFRARWNAKVGLRLVFWRDILAVGTVANLLFGFLALVLVAQGAPLLWAAFVHFALLPYNLFLLAAVWRSPERTPATLGASVAWFAAMLVV